MIGVVLCGGKSSRMSFDKGLLIHHNITWAQSTANKLASLNIPVKISINKTQIQEYNKTFDKNILIPDMDSLLIGGPLLALFSIQLALPNTNFFIVACDMPLINEKILKELFLVYQAQPHYDAYVYGNENNLEPLCGIYTTTCFTKILQLKKENKLIKHSMKFILSQLNVKTIALPETKKVHFSSFNNPLDLNKL
jgi:molybdenum cofactor guanylyltransferase